MKNVCPKVLLYIIAVLFFFDNPTFATDRNFAFTYESRTLQRGLRELEVWATYKSGRQDFYSALQNRVEFEVGLGKHLQTSFYLNLDASTEPYTFYAPVLVNGEQSYELQSNLKTQFNVGFSNEWKYQLSDPSANKIGSALYGELSISSSEMELEGKIILDKKLNRFVTAFNAVGELEWESEIEPGEDEAEWEHEAKVEFDYGLSYAFHKNFSIGAEARNSNIIHPEKGWEFSALFVGPVFSYKSENWWITLAAQPQLTDLRNGNLALEDHEKFNARLLFSYSF